MDQPLFWRLSCASLFCGGMTAGSIVLGSGSPRRRDLLEAAGFTVHVRPTGADESWPEESPAQSVERLAARKMDVLLSAWPDELDRSLPALTADTVVFRDATPLNKPADSEHACKMLGSLSGRSHTVITAFCIEGLSAPRRVESVETEVWFRSLRAVEIERYVATGEPFDKAGGYGIQGLGGALVDRLEGSYTNVVGLPLVEVLSALGVDR